MAILRRAIAQLSERRGADPYQPWGDSTPPSPSMTGSPGPGLAVNEKTALQVAAVYGSVGVLADGLSTLPLALLNSTDAKVRRQLAPSQLVIQPYAEISLIDWLTQATISLALRGNFFGQIIARDAERYPTQIKPVHPDRARVRRLPDGTVEYRFNGTVVPIDDVFHVRYLSVPDSLVGLNPIEYLAMTFGLARAGDLYGGAFFGNSAMPSGTIEIDDDLDPEETLALAAAWKGSHQGIMNAQLPAVLTGGAKFNPISISPRDAQFLELKQYEAGQISGMIFRVPPHMIGLVDRTTSWGAGIEQQERGFVTNTLGGYIRRLEEALTGLHPAGQFARFDLSDRLRGDKLQRYQAYSLGMLGGWLCADDVRGSEDMPPVPDGLGKTFLAPINTEPLQAMVEQSMQASAQAQQVLAGQSGDQPQQNGNGNGKRLRASAY